MPKQDNGYDEIFAASSWIALLYDYYILVVYLVLVLLLFWSTTLFNVALRISVYRCLRAARYCCFVCTIKTSDEHRERERERGKDKKIV